MIILAKEKSISVLQLQKRGGEVELAIDSKRSTAPTVSRGVREGCADLAPRFRGQ